MKSNYFISAFILITMLACNRLPEKQVVIDEIFKTEKAFENMAGEKGIAEAFYFYAADSAVIKRQNDTLIIGKENIGNYYRQGNYKNAKVSWTPDYIDVSDCRTMAYTYGQYTWKVKQESGDTVTYKGVFHTVWKKQPDGMWKYVWD